MRLETAMREIKFRAWDKYSKAWLNDKISIAISGRVLFEGQDASVMLPEPVDIVLMQYVNVVENGEMAAVWLKNEKRATLKMVYSGEGRIRLQPANSSMNPIFVEPDNVEIQGKVIAVIRRLP